MALAVQASGGHDGPLVTPPLTALLGGTWFAADLPAGPCARLAAPGTLVDIPHGSVVVQEGTICRALGVRVSGRIALRTRRSLGAIATGRT
jgi:hypothetical protein